LILPQNQSFLYVIVCVCVYVILFMFIYVGYNYIPLKILRLSESCTLK